MSAIYDLESGIVKQILEDAGNILAGGTRWCKKNNAIDFNGKPHPIFSPNAKKYDIYGACLLAHKRSGDANYGSLQFIFEYLKSCIPDSYKSKDIEAYNDDITWSTVEEILRVAPSEVAYLRATENGEIRTTESGSALQIGN